LLSIYSTFDTREKGNSKLINFYKFHLIGNIFENIYSCQNQLSSNLEIKSNIKTLFSTILNTTFSKRDIIAISHEREPKERSDGKFRILFCLFFLMRNLTRLFKKI